MAVLGVDQSVKYDDWGWHFDGTMQSGQPEINGFTHIGMYLVWIIKQDLYNPEIFLPDVVRRVKSGELTAHDLSDEIDGKLVSEEMSPQGKAFSDWYYAPTTARYLDDWAATFSRDGDYEVADNTANTALIGSIIGKRFAEWMATGRPTAPKPNVSFSAMPRTTQRWVLVAGGSGTVLGACLAVGGVWFHPQGLQGFLVITGVVLFVVSFLVVVRVADSRG